MDVVAEIKSKLDLVEFIGRTTRLQKAGRNFRGLCPFHTEKTPSFYVFPDRANWRCFGSCGEGGDLFSFVQKRENVDFRTAMRELAAEAGVQLSAESAERRSRTEKLASVMSAAVDYYQRCLRESGGEAAHEYLFEKRGITERAVDAFHLGWAPDEWRGLRDALRARGYDEHDMVGAGLLVENENGREPYDRFRGRVIIPITDERGQFVAMGGRGLHGEEPKYLNSPQTELFDKGHTLFGLNLAREAIRASGTVVVVEGYMDVIGPWQAGFENVVATMGTSLTENHAALLRRHAKRVVLAMDPDAAGLAAAERAGGLFIGLDSPEAMARSARGAEELMAGTELELRVAPLPAGKDPDEVARDDPAGWERAISHATPFAEFLLDRLMSNAAVDSPADARRVADRLAPVLVAVGDPLERARYVQRIARRLAVSEDAIMERIRQHSPRSRRQAPAAAVAGAAPLTPEEMLLALLLRHPRLRSAFRGQPVAVFTDAITREVFSRWLAAEDFLTASPDDAVAAYASRLERLRLPPLSDEEAVIAAQRKRDDIFRERHIQQQAALTEDLATAERERGAKAVDTISHAAWLGNSPPSEDRGIAEAVYEDYQLGLSIHRREAG